MVHDFAWAADPEYVHDKLTAKDGTILHFLYKDNEEIKENWKKLQSKTEELLLFFNENIGPYPWDQYSVLQGGDGGMEYAMCTLITGERNFGSLLGVTSHEMAHAWFQHLLATNEQKHEWMDEGFTTYISNRAMNEVTGSNQEFPNTSSIAGYLRLANSGYEQPQTTHADRYAYNFAYGASAYSKGATFLAQLEYIVGEETVGEILKEYYNQWKFKHPTPNDFKRIAEEVSGFELDWYLVDFTQTTNQIDYAVSEISSKNEESVITLSRKGLMPMPIDLEVTYADGSTQMYYIPLQLMRAEKETPRDWKTADDWAWAYPEYELEVDRAASDIVKVTIDPQNRMADVDRENNVFSQNSDN
jgi:aminopeptidase N